MKCSWESHLSGYLNENIHFVSVCHVLMLGVFVHVNFISVGMCDCKASLPFYMIKR